MVGSGEAENADYLMRFNGLGNQQHGFRKEFSTAFLYYTVKSSLKTITQYSSGSTFKEISAGVLKTVKIVLPKSKVVDHFTESVESTFRRQDLLEQENQQLAQLRDWLLPMLMNGQVAIK